MFHGGDTLWHGARWDIALAHGPIDIACLPANSVEIDYGRLQPAITVPVVMIPDQAVATSRALQVRVMVPIHSNRTFEQPHIYRSVADAREQLGGLSAERDASARFLESSRSTANPSPIPSTTDHFWSGSSTTGSKR